MITCFGHIKNGMIREAFQQKFFGSHTKQELNRISQRDKNFRIDDILKTPEFYSREEILEYTADSRIKELLGIDK
jgi:hypothetical protein